MTVVVLLVRVEVEQEVDIVGHRQAEWEHRDSMEEMRIWEVISREAEAVFLVLEVLRQALCREMVEQDKPIRLAVFLILSVVEEAEA
jgi:hypothetical protein